MNNMQTSPNSSPSYTTYHSAYFGVAIDEHGRFTNFVRRPDDSHRQNGYWRFHSGEDEQRAYAAGLHSPEDILVGVDCGDGPYNDINLRWVPGHIDTDMQGGVVGNASAQLVEIYNARRFLGRSLSFGSRVPVYPVDPRLKEYWDQRRHETTPVTSLSSPNTAIATSDPAPRNRLQSTHPTSPLRQDRELKELNYDGRQTVASPRSQTSSPRVASTASTASPHASSVSSQSRRTVQPRIKTTVPAGHTNKTLGAKDNQRGQSDQSPSRNSLQGIQQSLPADRSPHLHEVGAPAPSQPSVRKHAPQQNQKQDTTGPPASTSIHIASIRQHDTAPMQSNRLSHNLPYDFSTPFEPLTGSAQILPLEPLAHNPDPVANHVQHHAEQQPQRLKDQNWPAQELPRNTLQPSHDSSLDHDTHAYRSPSSSNSSLSTQSLRLHNSSLPSESLPLFTKSDVGQTPSNTPTWSQYPSYSPRLITRSPSGNPPSNESRSPYANHHLSVSPYPSSPIAAAASTTRSSSKNVNQPPEVSVDNSNTPRPRQDVTTSMRCEPNEKVANPLKRPIETPQNAQVQHKSLETSEQHAKKTKLPEPHTSPVADPDMYPGLACMECGEDVGHRWDCHIANLKFMAKPTMLDYRNLYESVQRFDPGPWTTHQAPPREPKPEDQEQEIRCIADIIRNEETCKSNQKLHTLPDEYMVLLWALKTSQNVEVINSAYDFGFIEPENE